MTNLIGKSLGRYHILEQLGEGGMAIVYKAFDTRLEREVAVKVIRIDNLAPKVLTRVRKRFDREAKALARLNHSNIVQVIDFGEYEGVPYLVMPYLPGGTLKHRIRHGRISWGETIDLLAPIARALEYAHRQNIVHRDIKPSNVILSETGAPMLSDFGVAKVLSDSGETHELTGTGMGVGTPEYMAPEQFRGQADERADIYALGVVMYEMVTGRKPYIAKTPAEVIIKQAMDSLPRPSRFAPDLPASVENILIKSLAKAPIDRYQRMGDFAQDLERLILVGEKEKKKREEERKKAERQQRKKQELEQKKQEAQKKKAELQQKKQEEKARKKQEAQKKRTELQQRKKQEQERKKQEENVRKKQEAQKKRTELQQKKQEEDARKIREEKRKREAIQEKYQQEKAEYQQKKRDEYARKKREAEKIKNALQHQEQKEQEKAPRTKKEKPLSQTRHIWRYPIFFLILITLVLTGVFGFPSLLSRSYNAPKPTQIHTVTTEKEQTPTKELTVTVEVSPTIEATFTPEATSTPEVKIGSIILSAIDNMKLVYVPSGSFLMGSSPDDLLDECNRMFGTCKDNGDLIYFSDTQVIDNPTFSSYSDEIPQHEIYLDSFWIDQTEITNLMYSKCVQANGCSPPSKKSSLSRPSYYGNSQYDNFPVVNITWKDSKAYCEWAGRRLPTEAEWEKAARGADSRIYPWGSSSGSYYANVNNTIRDTSKAGDYLSGASPYGALDMIGNVWEWVADWHQSDYYGQSTSSNPPGPSSGSQRVVRGGAFNSGIFWNGWEVLSGDVNYSATRRLRYPPATSQSSVGFRCVKDGSS